MSGIPDTITIRLDHDVTKALEAHAERLGISVESYIVYVLHADAGQIDRARFDDTIKAVFKRYGTVMRRLAEHDERGREADGSAKS